MEVDEKIENKLIAKEYKNLLRISYRSLSEKDKKLIRIAFDTAVDAHKNQPSEVASIELDYLHVNYH